MNAVNKLVATAVETGHETIEQQVQRLLAENARLKALSMPGPKFSVSDKGVFVIKTGGQGFPITLTPNKAKALFGNDEAKSWIMANMADAEKKREAYTKTEAYKEGLKELQSGRAAYKASR